MLNKAIDRISDPQTRNLALTVGGMAALLAGKKRTGVTMFARGFVGLEKNWRERNEFTGTFADRWAMSEAFYESTHSNDVNRYLHIVGIPMILGGSAGLLLFKPFRPFWGMAAGSFVVGWGLNLVGHGIFEKAAPALADDPLSFVAGPVWDFKQVKLRMFGADGDVPVA